LFKKIDHIGIVVADMEKAAKTFAELFGFKMIDQMEGPDGEHRSIMMVCGEIKLEIIQPLKVSGISMFLQEHGPGLHHVSLLTDDIKEEMKCLEEKGKTFRYPEPTQLSGYRLAFIRPTPPDNIKIELVENKPRPLEKMGGFFNARIDGYETHMIDNVEDADTYIQTAKLIPAKKGLKLLDLGCGTGLELDEIFKVNPTVQVTGIDLAEKMLEKLKQKHAGRQRQLNLIQADYFKYDLGKNVYDVVVSYSSLHHFSPEEKIGLYRKIYACLKPGGFYLEDDYMAPTQEFEDYHFAENKRIRAELGITEGYYHYDTPCTVENQIAMLKNAGFKSVEKVGQYGIDVALVARK
jgi:tRNA (cmo5U34)-methyltransferase